MAVLGVRSHRTLLSDFTLMFAQFEYGASWERPDLLPIWEAQVGPMTALSVIILR